MCATEEFWKEQVSYEEEEEEGSEDEFSLAEKTTLKCKSATPDESSPR